MTHKDPLLAAARGQPQTQGNKDARHGAYAGATTTAETHEPDAQQTKPTDASAPKPEADAKEAGAAGVPGGCPSAERREWPWRRLCACGHVGACAHVAINHQRKSENKENARLVAASLHPLMGEVLQFGFGAYIIQ